MDLVLKPVFHIEYALAVLVVLAVAAVFLRSNRSWDQKEPSEQKSTPPGQLRSGRKNPVELDDDAKAVLGYLDRAEGRATQMEIREALWFSDAKLSLILTEFEGLGKIRKFKRGRANIIRKL